MNESANSQASEKDKQTSVANGGICNDSLETGRQIPEAAAEAANATVPASEGLPTSESDSRTSASSQSAKHHNLALVAELEGLLSVVEPSSVANVILQRAFAHGATDIHLDPTTLGTRIRFRVDGVLQDIIPIPAEKAAPLLSRLRVMAGIDITDRRLPHDGAIPSARFAGIPRDVRVGTSTTVNGERMVLRLMPDPDQPNSLSTLGFNSDQMATVRRLLRAPYGLLLIVGPVGAGKSTTVYSMLHELNRPERSVVTIEDPVERRIPGANQIQVDSKTGLTFLAALRGTLRQDPNVLSIGEIRDAETAQIACRAATSGVLVLSTLHANNSAGAVDVLRSFGISSMAIADCLRGVISQRLVRKVCPVSREELSGDDETRTVLQTDLDTFTVARGIPADCNFHTGYRGRTAVFEVMEVGGRLQKAIHANEPAFRIHETAVENGMISLEQATQRKVLDLVTSVDELRHIVTDLHMSRAVEPSRAEPSRAEPSRTEPSRTEPNRTGRMTNRPHDEAEPGCHSPAGE